MSGLPVGEGELVTFDTGVRQYGIRLRQGRVDASQVQRHARAVRITEEFFREDPVLPGAVERAEARSEEPEGAAASRAGRTCLVGMGGTVTSLASVKFKMAVYDPDVVQGSTLTLDEINAQIADYAGKTPRTAARDRGTPAQAGGRDPRGGVHRPRESARFSAFSSFTVSDRAFATARLRAVPK
jgi:hypothetical protein